MLIDKTFVWMNVPEIPNFRNIFVPFPKTDNNTQ